MKIEIACLPMSKRKIFTAAACLFFSLLGVRSEVPSPVEKIKILAIGNSFTGDATSFLQKLARGGGKELTLFVAAVGGYSLEEHVARLQAFEADPKDPRGRPYGKKDTSLREALQKEDWDVVTIQQSSVRSTKPETFEPSMTILVEYIRKHAPGARILLFEPWAYPDDYYDQVKSLKLDHTSMRAKVKSVYQEVSEKTGIEIIPVGEAFERAGGSEAPITLTNPNDKHCNSQGRYLSGAVFYEAIFRDGVEGNSFRPPKVTSEEAKTLLRVAHETVAASPLAK